MKYLLIALLTSCSLLPETRVAKKEKTSTDKIERCLYRLIEKSGIKAEDAKTACIEVFRRN